MCRQKTDTQKLNHLRNLLLQLNHLGIEARDGSCRFNWNNHSRCRFGIYCGELKMYDHECDRLCEQLDPYLEAVAKDKGNKRDYALILRYLQGYYPQVYHEVVVLRNSGK